MPQGTGNQSNDFNNQQVIDFREVRAQKMEEKRRTTERIFFRHLLSVYSVVGDSTMCPIEIIDVSESGCSFQIPFDPDRRWPTDLKELPLRLYFSQDTYLEVRVKIENSRPAIENNHRYIRYGCSIDKTVSSYAAYEQFVRFMRGYAEHSHKDNGDVSVFYL